MKTNLLCCLILSVVIAILSGCNKPSQNSLPQDIADSLLIEYQSGPEIPVYGHIEALLNNPTSFCIVFPPDLGIRLFLEQEGSITEIHNFTKYIGDQSRYLEPAGHQDFISVGFDPDISDLGVLEATEFYAEITGHLCDDDSVVIIKRIPFVIVP